MLKSLSLVVAVASLLGLGACAGSGGPVQTQVQAEPSVNFSKFRTYAFAPPPATLANMNAAARAAVQNSLITGLAAHGITQSKTPDFTVVYQLAAPGTLGVDFVDVLSKEMFLRGTSAGPVSTQPQNDEQLAAGIKQMLASIPVLR